MDTEELSEGERLPENDSASVGSQRTIADETNAEEVTSPHPHNDVTTHPNDEAMVAEVTSSHQNDVTTYPDDGGAKAAEVTSSNQNDVTTYPDGEAKATEMRSAVDPYNQTNAREVTSSSHRQNDVSVHPDDETNAAEMTSASHQQNDLTADFKNETNVEDMKSPSCHQNDVTTNPDGEAKAGQVTSPESRRTDDVASDPEEDPEESPEQKARRERREHLLKPENLQRLLADALTYQSPIKDLTTIVKCGGNVNGFVQRGLRPLHYAVHAGYMDGIRFLLENGADVNAPDDIGYRPVHLCARKGLLEPLKVLIEHGAKIDFFEQDDEDSGVSRNLGYLTIEPLNMAIENNHIECARLLLSKGAKPDHQYFLGHEINLVPQENIECLSLLLEYGADPNVFSRGGASPLMRACKNHNIRAVRILLDNGANMDLQPPTRFEQKTAIHLAIQSGSRGITTMLLRRGAMVARPPGYRYSAVQTCVVEDNPDLCELVLTWDALVDEVSDENATALQLACATPELKQRRELVQILLTHGANPNVHSHFVSYSSPYLAPLTEYMRCVNECVDIELIRALVLHGANVHFGTASTANRVRDPHGILHCVQYLKDKPDVFHLLMSAATRFEPDSVRAYSSLSEPQRAAMLSVCDTPRDLRTLTHLRLRDLLTPGYTERVPRLPVPNVIKEFLLFQSPPVLLSD